MKHRYFASLSFFIAVFIFSLHSSAQFYDLANSLQATLTPALTGGGSYKGYVEAGYAHTLGKYKGDFVELSTSQGYRYKSWFYMGAGLGVDLLLAHKSDSWGTGLVTPPGFNKGQKVTETAVMLPLFTDFRFLLGDAATTTSASFYLDLKIGCSFLLSNRYIAIGDGYLTNREYFFLRPSIGVRIPVSKKNPKQAFDIGISYKLLTSNYWVRYNNNITLQALGANVAFEW